MLLSQAMRLYFLRNYAMLEDKKLHRDTQVLGPFELSQSGGLSQIELEPLPMCARPQWPSCCSAIWRRLI